MIGTGRERGPRWHLIFYLLAAFNLLTFSGALYLNHHIIGIFGVSVDVNRHWAHIQSRFVDLGRSATAVTAPGHRVFESGEVEAERGSRDREYADLKARSPLWERTSPILRERAKKNNCSACLLLWTTR